MILSMFSRLFTNSSFMKGVMTGIIVHKTYDYTRNSIDTHENGIYIKRKLSEKFDTYDVNKDKNISAGELLDGIIKDYNDVKSDIYCESSDPTVIFTKNDNCKNNR